MNNVPLLYDVMISEVSLYDINVNFAERLMFALTVGNLL